MVNRKLQSSDKEQLLLHLHVTSIDYNWWCKQWKYERADHFLREGRSFLTRGQVISYERAGHFLREGRSFLSL